MRRRRRGRVHPPRVDPRLRQHHGDDNANDSVHGPRPSLTLRPVRGAARAPHGHALRRCTTCRGGVRHGFLCRRRARHPPGRHGHAQSARHVECGRWFCHGKVCATRHGHSVGGVGGQPGVSCRCGALFVPNAAPGKRLQTGCRHASGVTSHAAWLRCGGDCKGARISVPKAPKGFPHYATATAHGQDNTKDPGGQRPTTGGDNPTEKRLIHGEHNRGSQIVPQHE